MSALEVFLYFCIINTGPAVDEPGDFEPATDNQGNIHMIKKIFLTGIFAGLLCASLHAQNDEDHFFKIGKNISVFNEIYKKLDMYYVDSIDADDVIGYGINAMLQRLDPYTLYYPSEKAEEFRMFTTGKFAGIGSVIRYNQKIKNVVIENPSEGSPAALAGLRRGDIILSVDDRPMEGKDVRFVSDNLRGEAGTTFKLQVRRPSTGKTMTMKITRQTIQNPAVPYYGMLGDGVGYCKLTGFTPDCSKEVRGAFLDMKTKGMKAFLLDLRSNGGGSEAEAANLVSLFVPKGELVVRNVGRQKNINRDFVTTTEPIDTVMPVVVLVDDESASSAEITAGALQDLDRAVIVGSRTYGKGLVQMTLPVAYNGTLKITTNKYYIPSGRCIQAIDYHKRRGGYVDHLPDSLTKVFYTRAGRIVKDGGGIKPDVDLQADSLTNIAYYLTVADSTEVMHDFIIDYVAKHSKIAPADKFEISDDDYEQFKQKVLQSGFTFDRESEKMMKALIRVARFEGYYDKAKEEFDRLESKLSHNLSDELDFNKKLIKDIISADIASVYYYQKGRIVNMLRTDRQVIGAVELAKDSERYRSILKPSGTSAPAVRQGAES